MTEARVILFGKLPTHGDFVARGLSAEAREHWDAWLSAGLGAARERLGEGFAAAYEAAPPWRFVLEAGEGWQAGALTASVDAAGRLFPIMLAVDGLSGEEAADAGAPLAEAMEEAIRDAFAQCLNADGLVAAAEARGDFAVTAGEAPPRALWWTEAGESLPGGVSAEELMAAMIRPGAEERAA